MKSLLQSVKAIIGLTLTLLCLNVNAQTNWETLPWRDHADFKLQPLYKNYVNTGILYDRVFPFANVDDYVGDVNSTDATSPGHFMQAYYEMYNAAYNTAGWISPEDLNLLNGLKMR